MSDLQINQLLAQMRTLAAQTGIERPAGTTEAAGEASTDFGALLKASIEKVNDTQQAAASLAKSFEAGDPGVELGEVMVGLQKANISFRAMSEVRNKLVNAYQEIMNMPV